MKVTLGFKSQQIKSGSEKLELRLAGIHHLYESRGNRIYHLPKNWTDNRRKRAEGGKLVGKLKIHFPQLFDFSCC